MRKISNGAAARAIQDELQKLNMKYEKYDAFNIILGMLCIMCEEHKLNIDHVMKCMINFPGKECVEAAALLWE